MRFWLTLAVLAALPLAAAPAAQKKKAAPRTAVRAPVKANWLATVVATPEGGVRMGNPAAAIKLVEYGSRTCPHCAKFDAEGFPVLKAGPIASGKLSYEFRDFPVHGALDLGPILLGRCVPLSKFFGVLDQMFVNQSSLMSNVEAVAEALPKGATPNQTASYYGNKLGYVAFMKKLGLPEARSNACLANPAGVNAIVARTKVATTQYKVQGTPTFIVNGKVVEGAYDWASLEPALRAAGM